MTTLRTLFVVMALVLSTIVASAQAVLYVRDGGSDANDGSAADVAHAMASIQHAIDEAEAGDVIDVGAGDFPGANISKDITIRGVGYGAPVSTWGADVTNITSKFTLDNPAGGGREVVFDALRFGANILPAEGLSTNAIVTFTNCYMAAASPVNTAGMGWSELVLAECVFDGDAQRDNAVLASGLTTFNVRESYFKKYKKSAITVSGAQKNITIEFSEFDNNNSSNGTSDASLKVDVASLTGDLAVKNNRFTNSFNSVLFSGALAGKNVAVQYNGFNSISGASFAIKNTGTGALPASCNGYGINKAAGDVPSLLSGSVEAGPYYYQGNDTNGDLVGFEPNAAQACATDGPIKSTTTETAGKSYFRIQDAVDASAAGATVKVLKGTYTGNVTIDKNVTVKGSYDIGDGADQDCDGRSAVVKGTDPGAYSNVVGVITVKSTANTVELSYLHITSPTATTLISNSSAVKLSVKGCWVEVEPTTPLTTVPVNGAINHVRAGELYCWGSMVTRPQSGAFINAISFASGNGSRSGTLEACRLEGTVLVAGMSVYADVQVKTSTIINGATDGFSLTGNTIRTLTIEGNTITSSQQHGIGFRGKSTVGSESATISNNYITGSGASNGSSAYAAIYLGGQTYGSGTHSYTNNHVSSQTGSAKGIVNERSDITPTATCNWWGSSSDDSFVAMASGNLSKSPFRISGGGYDPNTAGFAPSGACTGYEFAVTLAPTHVLCKDANTGAIGLTTSSSFDASNMPYTYAWSGPSSFSSATKSPSNLYAGSYTVTVTTAGGATKVRGISLTEPATNVTCTSSTSSQTRFNGSDMSCAGANDAEITITASGGTVTAQKPYQYSIDGGEHYQTSNVFKNLSAGNYEIKVVDGELCGSTTHFRAISSPTAVGLTSIDKKKYYGDLAEIVRYSGNYDNGVSYAIGEVVTYNATKYVKSVRNGKGAGWVPSTNPDQWQPLESTPDLSCVGLSNGAIKVNASGGTGTLNYSINGVDFQVSNTFTNLSANTYKVIVKDANGCRDSSIVTIVPPASIATSSAVTSNFNDAQISCTGATDGKIVVYSSGGTGALSYSKDGLNYQSSNVFEGLGAGNYTLTTKDINGCTATSNSTITAPSVVTQSQAKVTSDYHGAQISCFGESDGEITVTSSGGTGSLQYSSDNGDHWQNSNKFTGLIAGTYQIRTKDANGCTTSAAAVVVTQPLNIVQHALQVTDYNGSDVSCYNSADGVVKLYATRGTQPYEYSNDGGGTWQPTDTFTDLAPNTYKFVIRDANDCRTVTIQREIKAPSRPSFTFAKKLYNNADLSCYNSTNGEVTITAAGGSVDGDSPYTYSIDNGTYGTNKTFTGLAAGEHVLRVKDGNGCDAIEQTVTFTAPAQLVASTTKKSYNGADMTTATSNDGEITASFEGGTGSVTYAWQKSTDGINGWSSYAGTNNKITDLSSGYYRVTITDANSCPSTSAALPIASPSVPTFTYEKRKYTGADLSCHNSTNGEVTVTASNGTVTTQAPYTYSIDNGSFGTDKTFTGLAAGTHLLRVKDGNGSAAEPQVVEFIAPDQLVASIKKTDYNGADMKCATSNDGEITASKTGGTGAVSYAWQKSDNGTDGWASYGGNTSSISDLSPGYYRVTITDANGCPSTSSAEQIAAPTVPTFTTSKKSYSGANLSCYNSSNGELTVTASNGTKTDQAPYTYSIDNGAYGTNKTFTGLSAGTHLVRVKDGNGCDAQDAIVTFTAPEQLVASITKTSYNGSDMTCSTSNDGEITASKTGGTGSVTYAWEKSATGIGGWSPHGGNTSTISNLDAGYYRVTITDANSCPSTTAALQISAPSVPTFTYQKRDYNGADLSCYNSTNGEVTVTASNGTKTALAPYTYSIDNGSFSTNKTFTGLAAGTHRLRVADGNGCEAVSQVVTFTAPQQLVADASVTLHNGATMTCANANDGEITASKTGGTGAVSYAWEKSDNGTDGWAAFGGNTVSISGLSAGYYRVTITDANGCPSVSSAKQITSPSAVVVSGVEKKRYSKNLAGYISHQGAYDNGRTYYDGQSMDFTDGKTYVMVATNRGTGWNPNNAPGIWREISIPSEISCNGATDGGVRVSASGGTGTLKYSINGSPYQTSNEFAGLGAGAYTVTVKDANECPATTSFTISAPAAVTTSAAITSNYNGSQLNCNGSSDGQITVTSSGGTGTLLYSINGSAYDVAKVFSNKAAGSYTITTKDDNGCTATASVTITAPAALTASAAVTSNYNGAQIHCVTSSDGEITITSTGGTGTLNYSIDGTNFQPSNKFTGLGAGAYTFTTKDANGCTKTSTATIIAPANLTASAAVTSNYNGSQLNCATSADGQITVTSNGGTGTLTYSIDGETFQASSVFNNLAAGAYTLTTQDANGCKKTSSATITAPSAISFTSAAVTSNYNGSMVRCNGDANGVITAVATGGTGTLTYSISNSATTNTTGEFTGLAAGTYTITATDKNNCPKTSSVITIAQPAALTITSATATQNVTCFNGNNGEVTVTTTGGTGAITYTLSAGGSNSVGVFSNLAAGTYTVTAKDVNNCTTTSGVVTVTQPTELLITSAAVTSNYNTSQISCNGVNDGTITVVATGGVEPRTYSITGSATTNQTGVFSGLAAGTYKVTVADDHACSKTTSVITIVQPTAVSITSAAVTSNYNGQMIRCFGQADAQITAASAGGTGTRTFSISGAATTNTNGVFSNLTAGTYTITATDQNGCFATSSVITITQPTVVTMTSATVTSNHHGRMVSCKGAADGQITAEATGGTSTLTYSITGSGTTNVTGVFGGLVAGTYKITATDANGCFATSSVVTITEPDALTIASATVTSNYSGRMISCNGIADGQITVSTNGGTGTKTFTISGSQATNTTGVFGSLAAGDYTVSVTDENNCSTTTSTISITQPNVLIASASVTSNHFGSQISSNTASDGEITVAQTGGTASYSYKLLGSHIGSYATYGASKVFANLPSGDYTVWVKDANGCEDDYQITILAPSPVSSSAAVTSSYNNAHIHCYNSADGEITVTASGGTPPLTYKQTNPAVGSYTTNNVFTGLAAGVYEFTSQDANGNPSVSTATIVAPPQVQITSTPKTQYHGRDLSCAGAADGAFVINVTGGTGSIRYSINDGADYSTSNSFSNLSAATYSVRVIDANDCFATTSVVISAPPSLSVASVAKSNYNNFNVSCNGSTNGTITVTSNLGGTSPYEYSITGASGTIGYQASNAFTGLAAGTYDVFVKDVNGCVSPAFRTELTTPTSVTANPQVTSDYEGSDITCLGATNGALAANAGGGTGVYLYVWEKKSGANWNQIGTTATMSDLGAGTYRVTVTDQNGCLVTKSTEIVAPSATIVTASTTAKTYFGGYNVSCNGANDGEITVVGSGGTGDVYTYSIDSEETFQVSNKFTSLSAGTYQMRVRDINGCISNQYQVILTQPAALQLSISNSGPVNTNNNVSFIVQASGGTQAGAQPRYTYSWTSTASNGMPSFVGESVASGTVTSTFSFTPATDLHNGTYTVTVTDLNGCNTAKASQLIVYPSTIYVATSGNDATGDGRIVNPLRTIQKANDVAIADNTIMVQGGGSSYDESPVISKKLKVYATGNPTLAANRYFIYGTTQDIDWGTSWPTSVWDNLGVNGSGSIATALNKVNGGANSTLWIIGEHETPGLTISKQLKISGATASAGVPTYSNCEIAPTSIITHVPSSITDKNLFTMTGSVAKTLKDLELRIPNSSFFIEVANSSQGDVSSTENVVFNWKTSGGTYRRLWGVTNGNLSGGTEVFDVAKRINDGNESTSGFGSGRVYYDKNGPLPINNLVVGWKADDGESTMDKDNAAVTALSPMNTTAPRLVGPTATRAAKLVTSSSLFNSKYFMTFNGSTGYLDGDTDDGINSGSQKTLFVVFAPVKGTADQVIYKHGDDLKGMSIVQLSSGKISLNIYNTTGATLSDGTRESWIYDDPGNDQVLIAQIYFNGTSESNRAGASLDKVSSRLTEINHTSTNLYVGKADFEPTTLSTPTVNAGSSVSLGCRTGSYYYGGWNNNTVSNNTLYAPTGGRGLFFKGKLSEVLIMNTADRAVRDATYCYLRSKYTSDNTYGNRLEKDADVVAGDESTFEGSIEAYPNPVESDLRIEAAIPYGGAALVTIKDALGRTVKTLFDGQVSDNTVLSLQADVRDLTTGAYFINVVGTRETNITTPIMISR